MPGVSAKRGAGSLAGERASAALARKISLLGRRLAARAGGPTTAAHVQSENAKLFLRGP